MDNPSESIHHNDDAILKKNLINRLSKIEGQVRGIKKMIEDNRDCESILQQIASAKASIDSVGLAIVGCSIYKKVKDDILSGQNLDSSLTMTASMKPFLNNLLNEEQ